ncbi:Uncharacterized protein ycdB [Bacillus amyloliquefaciens]|nr:Uncharacterized protein ycdB [Bacillus amyloliquefaciens]
MMKKEELKQLALRIGNVPPGYESNVEEYQEDEVLFWWEDKNDPEAGIMVELEPDGKLKYLSRPAFRTDLAPLLELDIEERMRAFLETHRPGALAEFELEKKSSVNDGDVRYSYAQMADGLPLPLTGFYVDLAVTGEVTGFSYQGKADDLLRPGTIADKREASAHFVKQIEAELLFTVLHQSVYVQGDDKPHLVYDIVSPTRPISADLKEENEEIEEYEELEHDTRPYVSISRPEPEAEKMSINDMIGLHDGFYKDRESDLGEGCIGIAWRPEKTKSAREDKSFESLFKERNEHVLKTRYDKESGRLTGVMSFIQEEGEPVFSEEECHHMAIRFLFAMFPEADQHFRVQYDEPDDEGENAGLTYKACSGGVDLRFGEGRICVSKKTGLVTFYMPPDIDPKELENIDPVPSLTMEEAKDAIRRNIKAELAWDRYDDGSGRNVYRLVYKPVFPRFIEAHTGEAIMSLIG